MTLFQRTLIETKLRGFEAGRFQEFVLRFLPLFDENHEGMIRHGHTEEGKTRKGVPDLLKTFPNGDQIGCECGTAEDYWSAPKEVSDYPTWKPIEDGLKCLAKMARPIEVVLASNQPIPTNHPNAKTLVIDYLTKKESIRFTLLTSADIASWIERNLKRSEIFELAREFFLEAIENSILAQERDQLSSVVNFGDKFGLPTKDILEILKSSGVSDEALLSEKIATEVFGVNRFLFQLPGPFSGVARAAKRLPSILKPFEKIIQVLGAPKIGKSNLVWESIEIGKYNYNWLSTPNDERQEDDFIDAILLALYTRLMSYADAKLRLRNSRPPPPTIPASGNAPLVIVIDDAHLLSAKVLKRLNAGIADLKSNGMLKNVAVFVMTNKNLSATLTSIDSTEVAPEWNANEIDELLANRNIKIQDPNRTEYCEMLCAQAGGHPLFAIALAGKHPDRKQLVLNAISKPNSKDEDLSKEIKSVLYQDILIGADHQNFIQRLSLLTGKAQLAVLDAIRTDVSPAILTTAPNLIDEIGPAVLEGSVEDGLKVSGTFRDIAKQRITPSEVKEVYTAAANALLVVEGKTIHADRWIDAIFYLTLSDQIGRAAAMSLHLLYALNKNSEAEKDQVKMHILDRLFFFKFMSSKVDGMDYLTLSALRIMLAHGHATQGAKKAAVEYLDAIDLKKITDVEVKLKGVDEMKKYLIVSVTSSKVLALSDSKNPGLAVTEYLEHRNLLTGKADFNLDEMLADAIRFLPIDKLRTFDFSDLATRLYINNLDDLADIAISVGHTAKNDESFKTALRNLQKSKDKAVKVFGLLAESSWQSNSNSNKEALDLAKTTEEEIKNAGRSLVDLGPIYFQHVGDVQYGLGNYEDCIKSFDDSSQLESNKDDFVVAWNEYKIGLAADDHSLAEQNLSTSWEKFAKQGNFSEASRVLGALGAEYLNSKKFADAIEAAIKLADWYHGDKLSAVGPAVRLLTAQCLQAAQEVAKDNFSGQSKPLAPIDKKFYLTIDSSLRPQAGGIVTYQAISQLAHVTKNRDLELKALKKAIYSEVMVEMDQNVLVMNWLSLCNLLTLEEYDENELSLLLKKLTQYQPAPGSEREKFFMMGVFRPFEEKAKADPKTWGPLLLRVTEMASTVVRALDDVSAMRWDAYLDSAEGLAYQLTGNGARAYKLFRRATSKFIADKLWSVSEDGAFRASFHLWESHPSIKEAGISNYELFQCIEGNGLTVEKIINLGINMFRFWSVSDWRRFSTDDLKTKGFLSESAMQLKQDGFNEVEAAPILVALLLKLFNHPVSHSQLLVPSKKIPDQIEQRLNS